MGAPRSWRRWTLALLLLGIGAFLFVGLMPFTFDFDRPIRIYGSPINNILNLVCFVPLGALLELLIPGRRILTATIIAFLLSGTVETLQLFLPGRYPSLADLTFNSLGAAAGAWLAGSRMFSRLSWPTPRVGED